MFKKLIQEIREKRRVKGLSRAMSIVDEYMFPGMTPKALDHNYGQDYAAIRMNYINGNITENEMWATLTTLNNQYDKLRPQAVNSMIYR